MVSRLNRFVKKRVGGLFRPYFSHPAVAALVKFNYRRVQPLLRAFYPLFGINVMIGLTYKCQCRCVHCGTTANRDLAREELSEAEVLEIVRQAARLGAGGIYLFGGEPLLAPGLLNIVRTASGLGLMVTMDTNGLLMDKELAVKLFEAGLSIIGVSVDNAEEAEHDRLRGCPGAYRAAVNAIGFCRDAGMDVSLSTYATRESLRDGGLDRTIALARSLRVRARVLSSLRAGKWLERADIPFKPDDVAILRSKLAPDVYWETIFLTSPKGEFICGCAARTYFYVSPYGDVQPCGYMPLTFGNIRTEPMEKIAARMWGSAMFSSLDSSLDCPMNSTRFQEVFGGVLSRKGIGPHPAELASSPNDPAEWDAWAPAYGADVDWVEEIHNRDIAELAGAQGLRVLDIGCGTGRRARAVFGRAGKLTAVDSSRGMAAVAREVLAGLKQAEVLELDIEKDDLPAGLEFDAAVAVSTMHHLRDPEAALKRVKERLASGGVLVIVDSLSKNPPLTAARYYVDMLKLHCLFRLAKGFLRSVVLDTRVSRHKAREVPLSFEEFTRRYAAILPGAKTEVRHGIFGYLVWKKP